MRPGQAAGLAVVAAVRGGVAVHHVGAAVGWVGPARTETLVVPAASTGGSGERSLPAAVRSTARPLPGNDFDPARIYAERSPGVVTVYAFFGEARGSAASQGSGFVVSAQGYVLTNSHVITTAGEDGGGEIEPARRLYVQFRDGERIPARIVGWDVFDDVGLLRVDPGAHALEPLPLGDSGRVVVGEPVAAIGSPFGVESSLAVGVVSATERSISALTSDFQLVDAIQTDAPINRGNSGGPLFDARGRVIGINAQIRSETGTAEGVGFAVPINSAKRSLAELIEKGRVEYAYVGISTDDLTPSLARHLGYRVERGALVVEVNPGPARDAGLRGGSREIEFAGRQVRIGGDVVVAIGGRPVDSGDDLVRIVTEVLEPRELVTFTVVRGSRRLDVAVRLAVRPSRPGR
jgi:S1-C subfamily serine protease